MTSTVRTSHPVTGLTNRSSDISGLHDLFVWKQKATTGCRTPLPPISNRHKKAGLQPGSFNNL